MGERREEEIMYKGEEGGGREEGRQTGGGSREGGQLGGGAGEDGEGRGGGGENPAPQLTQGLHLPLQPWPGRGVAPPHWGRWHHAAAHFIVHAVGRLRTRRGVARQWSVPCRLSGDRWR